MIEKLSGILNSHMEDVVNAFDNNIDLSNLFQEVVDFSVIVDEEGFPISSLTATSVATNQQFSSNIVLRPIGTMVIRAQNQTAPTSYTTGTPFVHYSIQSDGLFKINKISGLQPRNKYNLRILLIGG